MLVVYSVLSLKKKNVCREKVRFSLKGAQHREKRFRIYRFLLENFTDAQRFNITNKINQTVLGEDKVMVSLHVKQLFLANL